MTYLKDRTPIGGSPTMNSLSSIDPCKDPIGSSLCRSSCRCLRGYLLGRCEDQQSSWVYMPIESYSIWKLQNIHHMATKDYNFYSNHPSNTVSSKCSGTDHTGPISWYGQLQNTDYLTYTRSHPKFFLLDRSKLCCLFEFSGSYILIGISFCIHSK